MRLSSRLLPLALSLLLAACGRGAPVVPGAVTRVGAPAATKSLPGRAIVFWRDAASRLKTMQALGLAAGQSLGIDGQETIALPAGQSLDEFRRAAGDAVVAADPDYLMGLPGLPAVEQEEMTVFKARSGGATQYALTKVNAAAAWRVTRGKPEVKIAIIDSGVDEDHPDLRGQIVESTSVVGFWSKLGFGGAKDDCGHGTHCAGVAAATGAEGISGLAPGCKLLVVKALDRNGQGPTSQVARGINWAVEHGASVISLSMGSPEDARAVRDAVARAQARGVVIVAAMGNDGKEVRNFPAAYPGVIAVGATTSGDKLASFSTRGRWISVSAPGANIWSTSPTYSVTLSRDPDEPLARTYGKLSGTSMATPLVAGLAGLVRSQHPDWSPAQVKGAIERGAVPLEGGHNARFGAGRIDAAATLGVRD